MNRGVLRGDTSLVALLLERHQDPQPHVSGTYPSGDSDGAEGDGSKGIRHALGAVMP